MHNFNVPSSRDGQSGFYFKAEFIFPPILVRIFTNIFALIKIAEHFHIFTLKYIYSQQHFADSKVVLELA